MYISINYVLLINCNVYSVKNIIHMALKLTPPDKNLITFVVHLNTITAI